MSLSHVKGYKGIGMEGAIATWYAKNTRRDIAEFRSLAARISQEIVPGSQILEAAPGPGYLSIELARCDQYEVTGLDISKSFVEIARKNAARESVCVDFRRGNASAMPFEDNSFDFVVCRAAFKNFTKPLEAINEMFRVLKPGGRAMIIDLRQDASGEVIGAYVDRLGLGWLDSMFTKLTLKWLTRRAHSIDDFQKMASNSQFGRCEIIEAPMGIEVVFHKLDYLRRVEAVS
jgi:ubiquinone/menaquinone biosynthesis C-methylase UbiE